MRTTTHWLMPVLAAPLSVTMATPGAAGAGGAPGITAPSPLAAACRGVSRMRARSDLLLSSKKIHLSCDETGVNEVRLSGV